MSYVWEFTANQCDSGHFYRASSAKQAKYKHWPDLMRYVIPPVSSELAQMLNHLSWLLSTQRSSGSTPSCLRMSELLTLSKAEQDHPAEEAHFSRLFFRSLPKAHDHRWGSECRWPSKLFTSEGEYKHPRVRIHPWDEQLFTERGQRKCILFTTFGNFCLWELTLKMSTIPMDERDCKSWISAADFLHVHHLHALPRRHTSPQPNRVSRKWVIIIIIINQWPDLSDIVKSSYEETAIGKGFERQDG